MFRLRKDLPDRYLHIDTLLRSSTRLYFALHRCIQCTFDGISQLAVFIRECIGRVFSQHVIIRFGDADIDSTFACFSCDVLTIVNPILNFTTSFTFLATLSRLFTAWMLMLVASSWAARVTFLFRFFSLPPDCWFGGKHRCTSAWPVRSPLSDGR